MIDHEKPIENKEFIEYSWGIPFVFVSRTARIGKNDQEFGGGVVGM